MNQKTSVKHISCECKCRSDGRNCNSDQWWNNDKCWCKYKKHHICEKDYIWNPSTRTYENGKCVASIMDDSAIIYDEIIEKTIPTNFNENKATCKTQNFYIALAFLLITMALFTAVSIYCYLITYWAKKKKKTFITISQQK